MTVNCWGPSVGAKAVRYKTAVILGVIGQSFGTLFFGPEMYSAYGQFLAQRNELPEHPLPAMYALMWIIIVPITWHILAIRQKILLPLYLGNGMYSMHAQHPQHLNVNSHLFQLLGRALVFLSQPFIVTCSPYILPLHFQHLASCRSGQKQSAHVLLSSLSLQFLQPLAAAVQVTLEAIYAYHHAPATHLTINCHCPFDTYPSKQYHLMRIRSLTVDHDHM